MAPLAEDPGVSNNRILALAVRPLVVGTSEKLLNTLRLLCRGSRLAADAERRCVSICLPTEEPACSGHEDGAEHPPSPIALLALLGRLPALAHVTVCQEPAHHTHSSTDALPPPCSLWPICLSALQPAHLRSLELDGLALAPSCSGSNPVNAPAGAITPESLAALLHSAPGLNELALLRVTILTPATPPAFDPVVAPHAQHAEPGSTAGQRSTPAAQALSPGAWCPILAALPSGLVSLRLSLSAATQEAAAECCGRASRGPRLAALGGAGAADGWARRAPPDATACRWGQASPGAPSSGRPGATSSGSGMGTGGPAPSGGGCACSSAQPCPACLGVALRRLHRLTRLELSGLRAGGAVAALAAAVRPVAAAAGGGAQPQIQPPGRLGSLERLVLDLDGHVDMASMQGVVGCLPRLRHLALVEQAPLRGRRRPQRRPPHVHPPPPLPPPAAAGGPGDGVGGPGGSGDGPSGSPPGSRGGGGGDLGSPSGGASAGERQPAEASGPAGNAAENGLGLHSRGLERSPTVSLNGQAEAGLESPSRSPGQLSPVSSSPPSSTSSSSASSSSSSSFFSSFGPPSFAVLPVTPAEPPDEEQSDQDPVSYHPLGAVLWMLRRTDLRRLSFSSDRSFTTLEPPPLLLPAAPEPFLAGPLLPPASHGPGSGSDADADDGGGRWGHSAHGHTAAAAAAAAAASSSPHPSLSTPELPLGPPAEPLIPAPAPSPSLSPDPVSAAAAGPEPALASVRLSLRLSAEALEPLVACLPPSVASLTLVVGALHRPADVIAAYTAAADEAAAAAARAAAAEEAAARAEGEAAARAAAAGGEGEGGEEAEGRRVAGGGKAAAGAGAVGAASAGSQGQGAGGTGAGAGARRASQGQGPGPGQRTPPPSLDAASPAWLSVPPLSFLGGVRFTWPALTQLPRVVPRLRELRLGGGAAAACGDHVLRCWAGASGDPDSLATPMVADPSFNAMLRVPAPPPPQQLQPQQPGPGLGPADDAPPQAQPHRIGPMQAPAQAQARPYGHTHAGAFPAPHGSPLGLGPAAAAGPGAGAGQEPPEGLGLGGSEWARSLERVCLLAAGPTISACLHLRRFMGSLRRLQVVVDGRLTDVAVGGSA
ncbi:hypothetical protein HYH03_002849 [Edaphochlamys debaryana]|uniref:Uncharacterized protein n=1 Tax=Edaphochlamys debaryana TaxID=47281 RepID=A0A836C3M8_9CHLO|nr:hypothetical protein HYH03_002849 [Edaphochlamys debaryana]|eukprot:KAG2499271.1 hypothetical protein HYH03_002849 [Edaphochlamys debaryana]